jgi:endonuclease-3 related protein
MNKGARPGHSPTRPLSRNLAAKAAENPKAPALNPGSLRLFYRALRKAFGRQDWWPGETAFEIIVGAILTQNTSWANVEKAIAKLKAASALSIEAMEQMPEAELAQRIRSSGYYRQKARKLKAFLEYVRARHQGSLERMFQVPTAELRLELLAVHGIGEETADSILLYAGGHATFVVDAYTRRILKRHGLLTERWSYSQIQRLFHEEMPAEAPVYNEFHALLVVTGKRHCLKGTPRCEGCPLQKFPHLAEAV